MLLGNHAYSALVVSSSDKFPAAVKPLLSAVSAGTVKTAASIPAAERLALEQSFDIVIVNAPVLDDPGIKFAIDQSENRNTICLLLVKSEHYGEVRSRVTEHGVFTLPKPTSTAMLTQGLEWLVTARERMRKLDKKNVSIQDKMEEIRTVNRAKWILIENLKMAEPEAHRYIEKQAMDRCIGKRQVAEEIIKTYQ